MAGLVKNPFSIEHDKELQKNMMFYEFLSNYNKNDDLGSGIEFKPAVSGIGPITNVIDGQQRITTMYLTIAALSE